MKVGILCSKIRIEEKLLLTEFEKAGIEVTQLDPRKLILTGKKADFANVDILLNREIGQTRAELILDLATNLGIQTINTSAATVLCNNKALTSEILERKGFPVPKTVLAFSQAKAIEAAKEIGFPIVLKPVWGSWGRLISKISTEEGLEAVLEHKETLGGPQHSIFYIQQYIEKPDRDIRVFVIGGEPVAGIYRVSKHWLTNTAKGAVPHKMELTKEVKDLTRKIVQILKVDIAGVDLVEYENGYLIFEVNPTPEFHGLKEVSDVNIAEVIVDYVQKRRMK